MENIPLEIERKFLLRRFPNLSYLDVLTIFQFYTKSKIRYRCETSRRNKSITYYQTIKHYVSPGVNHEDEKIITADVFYKNIKNGYKGISKLRYIWQNTSNQKFEIDVFPDHENLIILEVEVKDINEKILFPKYFFRYDIVDKEVTGDKKYNNSKLAIKF